MLACHAVHLLRRRLAGVGFCDNWTTIRQKVVHLDCVATRGRTVDGRLIENCLDTIPSPEAAEIVTAVGVEAQLHRKQI